MTERFTVSMDRELAGAFERYRRDKGYASRSEAVRDLVRAALAGDCVDAQTGHCVGVLTYVFDHEARDLGQQLIRDHHDHHDLSVATLHVHLDHEHCLEATVVRGLLARVRAFADSVVSRRGVQHGELHLVPVTVQRTRHAHGTDSGHHEHLKPSP